MTTTPAKPSGASSGSSGKPRRRRQYGTGSIHQRADGKWVGTAEAGWTTRGTRRRIKVVADSEAEAKRRLKARQRELAEGRSNPSVSRTTTVKTWAETWLETTRHEKRPQPWTADRSAVWQFIVPTVGHRRLDQLTPADVRAVVQAMRAAGKSGSTMNRYAGTFTSMLRAAILEGHDVPRRVLDVKPPPRGVSDRDAMPIEQALAMLQVASALPHGSRWAMAFLHGFRQGECLGLTWDSVDLDRGLVHVEWELQLVPLRERGQKAGGYQIPEHLPRRQLVDGYHLLPPKTKSGFRVLQLVPAMHQALTDWKAAQQLLVPDNPHGLVWPALDGRPANEKEDRAEWHALQASATLDGPVAVHHPGGRWWHVHEARHTTATLLLELGVDHHIVTRLLGHSSMASTRGYQHVDQAAGLSALNAIAEQLQLGR